jgi:hypothetical protein
MQHVLGSSATKAFGVGTRIQHAGLRFGNVQDDDVFWEVLFDYPTTYCDSS